MLNKIILSDAPFSGDSQNITAKKAKAQYQPRISVSRQMHEKFQRRKIWRRSMAISYIILLCAYLFWRFTIINPESLSLSITYYTTECIGFILGLKAIFNSWNYNHRDPLPAPADLKVDILLPVYKEPLDIIRRTAMAAKNIRYPHRTIILDDGKNDEIKSLAADLGIDYLRRPDNANAKAGNLNYGLQNSRADYVAVFDADHIAMPHALDIMLGFFGDDKVAMVQTPQDYYNIDAFQYVNAKNGALWHDQSIFYNLVQPCADKSNAAECVGTGVIYRRSALDKIGGIPTSTVTEDTHTSLCLHKAGYQTVYINEPVAYGLAAADLSEYYKTRHRWGFGNLQAMREEKILCCKNLTFKQRLHYIFLSVIYLEGWQQLLIFLIPCLTLMFGLQSFTVTVFNTLVIMAFPFISYALLQEIGCGYARYWANEIFSMARWPVYLKASAGLFGGKMHFSSSHKTSRGIVSWRLMMPQLCIMALCLISIGIGMVNLVQTGFKTGPLVDYIVAAIHGVYIPLDIHATVSRGFTVDLFILSAFWALYTVARVVYFVQKSRSGAQGTHDYFRFQVPVPVEFSGSQKFYGCITSLSEEWASIGHNSSSHFKTGEIAEFTAFLPAGSLALKIHIENTNEKGGTQTICGKLIWDSATMRDKLANSLYSVDWHREFLHRNAHFKTPIDILLACFKLSRTPEKKHEWHAILLNNTDGTNIYGIVSATKNSKIASLIIFSELARGQHYKAIIFKNGGYSTVTIEVKEPEVLHSLAEVGLDGARPRRYAASQITFV